MNILKINLLLALCILFSSCSQSRNYANIKLNKNAVIKENYESTLSESDQYNRPEIESNTENVSETLSDETTESESTQLIEYLDESKNIDDSKVVRLVSENSSNKNESGLTLSDLEALALNNHPEIQQSLADVSSMKGQRFQVTRKNNPVIGYQAQEVGNEGEAGQQGVFINQTFITADKLCLNGQIAGHLVQKKNWEWQVKEIEILNNVRRNYYDYQGAVAKLKLAKELLKISEVSSTTVAKLIKSGDSKKSQQLQADIQLNRNNIAVYSQQQNVKASLRKLMASVGTTEMQNESVQKTLPKSFPIYDWDQLYQTMISSHPSIQAARSQVQSANWAIKRAEVEKIPDIQTQLGVLYDTSTLDTVVGLQVGGALPIHDQNKGNVRSRYAEYMKAIQEVERVKLNLTAELADAFQTYESNRVQTAKFNKNILPKANDSLELISKGFRQRQDSYIQLLIAQRTYFESNQEFVDIVVDTNQRLADLHKLKAIQ